MITKFGISALLLLLAFNSSSQTVLSQGPVPSGSGTERLLAQQHKSLRTSGTSNGKEILVGVADLENISTRAEGDFIYTNIIHFILQYDPQTNSISSTTSSTRNKVVTTSSDIKKLAFMAGKKSSLSEMNFMEMQISTQNAISAVDINNLMLNGQTITGPYTRANSAGTSTWHISDLNFGSGFLLTGTITLTGTFGNSPEANKVEFTFGNNPPVAGLPVVFGEMQVKRNHAGNNELQWTTLKEMNAEGFLIQRSDNGKSFLTIGRRTAKGNHSDAANYVFEDAGYSKDAFYRMIILDAAGRPSFSKVLSITGRGLSSVFFNGMNKLIVQSTDSNPKTLRVIDANGRSYIEQALREHTSIVDVSMLYKGLYFVQLNRKDGVALKFFKK
jgi:hypothetical protein